MPSGPETVRPASARVDGRILLGKHIVVTHRAAETVDEDGRGVLIPVVPLGASKAAGVLDLPGESDRVASAPVTAG